MLFGNGANVRSIPPASTPRYPESMGSDFYSPQQAARILSRSGKTITERRVRQMLQAGDLDGERLSSGRWRVDQGAVHALLEDRRRRNDPMTDSRNSRSSTDRSTDQTPPETSLSGSESVRELLSRVEALSRELGRSEARLELTERTESSIREERDQLQRELEAEREERRRLQERLDQLQTLETPPTSTGVPTGIPTSSATDGEPDRDTDPGTTPEDTSKPTPEAPEPPGRRFEGYGSGEGSEGREKGVQAPQEHPDGLIKRAFRQLATRILRQ